MTGTRRTTLNDLAEGLGLSANTVSRALSGKDGVSDRTRSLVVAEAHRSGYLPTADSPERAATRSRTLAVAIPSATHVFSSELIGAIESGARSSGYSLDVFTTGESVEQEEQIARTIIDHDLAGAIVIPVRGDSEPWASVVASGRPVVAVSREIGDLDCDYVTVDNEAGSYAAVRHLLAHGGRRIVQFEEDLQISTINSRRAGFARAMAEHPEASAQTILVPTRRYEKAEPHWRSAEAHRSCLAFLDRAADSEIGVDAIVTGDDYFALGALAALRERGITVPDDVALIGYGDHPYAAWLDPALSTVRLPSQLIGELAVSLLLQRIAGESGPAVRRLVKPELIIRQSSVGQHSRG